MLKRVKLKSQKRLRDRIRNEGERQESKLQPITDWVCYRKRDGMHLLIKRKRKK